jgi:hypothetical protein
VGAVHEAGVESLEFLQIWFWQILILFFVEFFVENLKPCCLSFDRTWQVTDDRTIDGAV